MERFLSPQTEELVPLLAAFDAAASEGHVTRAAEMLGVPQSSLSRRLRTLETILGVELFARVGRGVVLTAAGRELSLRTRHVLRQLDHAVDTARGNADYEHGLVRFGFPLSLGPVSIPSLLADFSAHAPGIRLSLIQAHGEELSHQVRDGRLDLAVMIPAPDDLPSTVIGLQRIHLAVSADHQLAHRESVRVSELADEVFIANPPSFHLRGLLETWCAVEGFTPRVALEIAEFDTLRAFVAHGRGVALLPHAETAQKRLAHVRLTGARDRSIGLVTGQQISPAVQRLQTHIAAHANAYLGPSITDR